MTFLASASLMVSSVSSSPSSSSPSSASASPTSAPVVANYQKVLNLNGLAQHSTQVGLATPSDTTSTIVAVGTSDSTQGPSQSLGSTSIDSDMVVLNDSGMAQQQAGPQQQPQKQSNMNVPTRFLHYSTTENSATEAQQQLPHMVESSKVVPISFVRKSHSFEEEKKDVAKTPAVSVFSLYHYDSDKNPGDSIYYPILDESDVMANETTIKNASALSTIDMYSPQMIKRTRPLLDRALPAPQSVPPSIPMRTNRLERHSSEPTGRRCIFDQFWKQQQQAFADVRPKYAVPPPPPPPPMPSSVAASNLKRSSSYSSNHTSHSSTHSCNRNRNSPLLGRPASMPSTSVPKRVHSTSILDRLKQEYLQEHQASAHGDPVTKLWYLKRFAPPSNSRYATEPSSPGTITTTATTSFSLSGAAPPASIIASLGTGVGITSPSKRHEFFIPVDDVVAAASLGQSSCTEMFRSLPTLPSPLRRFYKEPGLPESLRGMYPVLSSTPSSILRQSSYRGNFENKHKNEYHDHASALLSTEGYSTISNFNLTESLRPNESTMRHVAAQLSSNLSDVSSVDGGDETQSTKSSNSSNAGAPPPPSSRAPSDRRVHFDPRVTVSEYHDSVERLWFNDADLDRFKYETTYLAQTYLMRHPELFYEYDRPVLDPITKTMRKKPLYTLPALSTVNEDEDQMFEEGGVLDRLRDRRQMQATVDEEVRSILIVDRNRMILDLFRKSMQPLFPRAKIMTVHTGEEAFHLVLMALQEQKNNLTSGAAGDAQRGFDMIIAEERLYRPVAAGDLKLSSNGMAVAASDDELSSLSRTLPSSFDLDAKATLKSTISHSSLTLSNLNNTTWVGFSGSELFRKIVNHLESVTMAVVTRAGCVDDAIAGIPLSPLLIGVSTHPENDATRFLQSGADFVWGKPPPGMNDCLRDQLVTTLMQKRSIKVRTELCHALLPKHGHHHHDNHHNHTNTISNHHTTLKVGSKPF